PTSLAFASVLLFAHLLTISSSFIPYLLGFLAIALFFTPYISLERFNVPEKTEVHIEILLYLVLTSATFLIGFYWFLPENGMLMGIVAMQALIRVFYELNIIHGGADAKALMLVALLFPTYPHFFFFPLASSRIQLLETMFPFTLTVLLNSVFWFIFYPFLLFLYNAGRGNAKIPNAFLGYKIPIKEARKKFVWLMEHPVGGKVITQYMPKKDEDENIQAEIAELERLGKKEIWVTPQIPFIIPITVGLFISIAIGNILFLLLGISSFHALYFSQVHLYL
ncbi:MAG: A24 family peptidase C-terminal domain-containing protein, partial [Thermoplasmata archaeon]